MSELVDKDAFLKQERKWYCENCDRRKGVKNGRKCFVYEIGEVPCRACDVDDVLDDLECFETIDTAPRWVRCEEELPKNVANRVLAYCQNGVMYAAHYEGGETDKWYMNIGTRWEEGTGNLTVTHWMPLPEPPKEITNE